MVEEAEVEAGVSVGVAVGAGDSRQDESAGVEVEAQVEDVANVSTEDLPLVFVIPHLVVLLQLAV